MTLDPTAPSPPPPPALAPQPGDRRDRARDVGPAETGGRRMEADLWLQPGAAVARAHVHDHFLERFDVREGEVGFQIAGTSASPRPGNGPSRCPRGPCTTGGTRATASPMSASSRGDARGARAAGRPFRVDDRGAVVARRARPRQRPGCARPAVAGGDRARVPRRDPLRQAAGRRPGRALRTARRDRPPDRPRPARARSSTDRGRVRDPRPRRRRPRRAARPAGGRPRS